jgi:tRNA threonylcarbamoyladenosine modification (KEOPS) complex  Pcc1 subunit
LENELKLSLDFGDEEKAKTVLEALKPDGGQAKENRSQTEIRLLNSTLLLHIKAADLTALRASLNGYLKLIILANDLLEVK